MAVRGFIAQVKAANDKFVGVVGKKQILPVVVHTDTGKGASENS